jgi:hypothetical protein
MIRRYIAWRNRHADDKRLHSIVDRANIACCGTSNCTGRFRPRELAAARKPATPVAKRTAAGKTVVHGCNPHGR